MTEQGVAVLVHHEARANRVGIDGHSSAGLTVGPGRPVRAALLVGASPRVSQVARRAILASGIEEAVLLRVGEAGPFGDNANLLRALRPDVVVLQGDEREIEGLLDLLEALRAGCADQQPPPAVFACGPHAARLGAAGRPFPAEVLEDLGRADALGGFVARMRDLRRDGAPSLVLRDEALESLARLFAAAGGAAALVVDVTGGSTSLVRAEANGDLRAVHAVPLGVGRAADHVVARAGLDRVRRWIPRPVDAPSLLERVFNRARWPDAVAAAPLALALEIALAHESIAHALDVSSALGLPSHALRAAPLIALTGRLADLPLPAQSLLVAVDALEPPSVAAVLRERSDALVALGALAARGDPGFDQPVRLDAAPHAERLALVVPVTARSRAVVTLRHAGVRRDEPVEPGAFRLVPLSGPVEVSCGSPELRGSGDAGLHGVLLDARGRPLSLPPRDAERLPAVARWFAALGAMPGGGT